MCSNDCAAESIVVGILLLVVYSIPLTGRLLGAHHAAPWPAGCQLQVADVAFALAALSRTLLQ